MSQPKKVRSKFSAEEELKLIDLVEEREILWDATCEIYKRADLRPQVWSDVAEMIGPSFTADDVMSRFKSLKDTFMKNYRRVNEAKKSGAGVDDLYKPKWNMFNRLLFLKKVCSQSTSTSNINLPENTVLPVNVSLGQQPVVPLQYFDENLQELVDIPMDGIQIITHGPVSEDSVFSLPSPCTSRPSSAASCPPHREQNMDRARTQMGGPNLKSSCL